VLELMVEAAIRPRIEFFKVVCTIDSGPVNIFSLQASLQWGGFVLDLKAFSR
jgi:hypothetical protein